MMESITRDTIPLTSSRSDAFINYHPGLPSLLSDNYEAVYAEHVPILVVINGMKIISWNVLELDSLHDYTKDKETYTQKQQRYQKIATSICQFITTHSPHFIALQGVYADSKTDSLMTAILQKLPKRWQAVSSDEDYVTLYYSAWLSCEENPSASNSILLGMHSIFKRLDTNQESVVEVLNVRAEYKILPHEHIEHIQEYLLQGKLNSADTKIVIGDFNCHIAPPTSISQTIATSAFTYYREGTYQGAYAIDGAFYSYYHILRGKIMKQAPMSHLDPKTGKLYEDIPLHAQNACPKAQWQEITMFRPIISIDNEYVNEAWVQGKTLSEQQAILRETLSDTTLLLCDARNLHNKRALGLFSLDTTLQDFIKKTDQCRYYQIKTESVNSSPSWHAIYIPVDKIADLFLLLERIPLIKRIEEHFQSYLQPTTSLFKSSRSFPAPLVNSMQSDLIFNIQQGKLGATFCLLQSFSIYTIKCRNKEGSLTKRLSLIKQELSKQYPLLGWVHKHFLLALDKEELENYKAILNKLELTIMQALDTCSHKTLSAQAKKLEAISTKLIQQYQAIEEDGFYLVNNDNNEYTFNFLKLLQQDIETNFTNSLSYASFSSSF